MLERLLLAIFAHFLPRLFLFLLRNLICLLRFTIYYFYLPTRRLVTDSGILQLHMSFELNTSLMR